jgi:hypothetical protein
VQGRAPCPDTSELRNSQLSSARFADVKTFERTLSGNADDTL